MCVCVCLRARARVVVFLPPTRRQVGGGSVHRTPVTFCLLDGSSAIPANNGKELSRPRLAFNECACGVCACVCVCVCVCVCLRARARVVVFLPARPPSLSLAGGPSAHGKH